MNVQESVQNNLSGLLGVASAKVKSEVENKKQVNQATKTFHQKEFERYSNDPANGLLIQARARGLQAASNFIKSACDSTSPSHASNFGIFKSAYNLDTRRVEAAYISNAMEEMGASEFEFQDKGYEDGVIKKFKQQVTTDTTQEHMLNLFKEACQAKWNSRGYRFDSVEIPFLASKYGLKSNDQIAELQAIALKP